MNVNTGEIITPKQYQDMIKGLTELENNKNLDHKNLKDIESLKKRINEYIPMNIPPTESQLKRMKVGRNDPCPCGSGKKFKKCHLYKKDEI